MKVEWAPGVRSRGSRLEPYVIVLEVDARRLHAAGHRVSGCWCDALDGDPFLYAVFSGCLEPRGFEMTSVHAGPGLKITGGPGLYSDRVDELEDAIRAGAAE